MEIARLESKVDTLTTHNKRLLDETTQIKLVISATSEFLNHMGCDQCSTNWQKQLMTLQTVYGSTKLLEELGLEPEMKQMFEQEMEIVHRKRQRSVQRSSEMKKDILKALRTSSF